ncbi:unnamed protein product [Oppiella nova]|uniref:Uncharacterized protein n=1 Tax=Oppiella nova TaxID=334625 RepID=A0A7R9QFF6_9ACAR|nr:unnamed protein product [Oppiella nova]CAG2164768.1 unnamed protein product [Oppiella nova]
MAKKTYDLLFKLLLIGDSGVGKTCILFRFSDDAFNTTFISTIGIDFKIKTIELRGKRIKLQIWFGYGRTGEVPHDNDQHNVPSLPILQSDAVVFRVLETIVAVYRRFIATSLRNYVLYSTVPLSHNLFISCVVQHANEDVEKMILGNKCDMDDKRMITRERGETIAREHNIRFLETSAKANINIDRAFLELAEAILNKVCHYHAIASHSVL